MDAKLHGKVSTTRPMGPPNPGLIYGIAKDPMESDNLGSIYEEWVKEYSVVFEVPSALDPSPRSSGNWGAKMPFLVCMRWPKIPTSGRKFPVILPRKTTMASFIRRIIQLLENLPEEGANGIAGGTSEGEFLRVLRCSI